MCVCVCLCMFMFVCECVCVCVFGWADSLFCLMFTLLSSFEIYLELKEIFKFGRKIL